jgi:hypothetical protein
VHGRLLTDVEVLEEPVERGHALRHAPFDDVPLARGDEPRQQVHREGAFGARLVAVDREGDALGPEQLVADALATVEVLGVKLRSRETTAS